MQFIFGIGTGRCGTGTLAELLGQQKGIYARHEGQFCPWEKDIVAFYQSICDLMKDANELRIATVAFYWRNYLSEIFRDFNNPKVIVLKRAREGVVNSFGSMYRNKNHWSNPEWEGFDGNKPGVTVLNAMWPKYDLPKLEAIGAYWDEYYNDGLIDYWLDKFPQNIMLMRSEELWKSEDAQRIIFDFIEIDESDRVYDTSVWKHKRQEDPPYLALDREPPSELRKIAIEKALYGRKAMEITGRPLDVEVQLTEEEFSRIDPKSIAALNAEKEEHARDL